ncbi:MAG TPA: hypothetical protein PL110_19405 [Candidatus Eremiobacteraeota bacterium]|nr:MAG: hypothetical protein BWY64_03808 [bacterium ADurb.Bin363]HPZ10266.1 hypothetical protein [Candidatus Eremiobacteraeota bacterium]
MNTRVIIISVVIVLLSITFTSTIYAEESLKTLVNDKIIEDLQSEDLTLREKAIDKVVSAGLETIKGIVEKANIEENSNNLSGEEKEILNLTMGLLEKFALKNSETVKASLADMLKVRENREIIVPFLEVFLKMLNKELVK